jgi:SPOR domain
MGMHKPTALIVSAFVTALVLPLAPAISQSPQPAATAKPAAAPAKTNSDAALKAYGSGTRAYETGRSAEAVQSLTTAVSAGGLQSSQMAKALYYRGMAQKKLGKPALAISDLTSAIWLKGGLSDTDRASAIQARQAAHKEAGLGDVAPPVPEQAVTAAAPVAAPVVAAVPAASAPVAAAVPVAVAAQSNDAAVVAPTAEVTAPAASIPVAAVVDQSSVPDAASILSGNVATVARPRAAAATPPPQPWALSPDAAPSSTVAAVIEPVPAAPIQISKAPVANAEVAQVAVLSADAAPETSVSTAPVLSAVQTSDVATPEVSNPLANAGQAVGGFFGNIGKSIGSMFNSNSSSSAAPQDQGAQATQTSSDPVMTSSTSSMTSSAAPSTGPTVSASDSPAGGWGRSTVTAGDINAPAAATVKQTAKKKPVIAAKPLVQTAAVAVPGNFKLQVAAVRSREEAEKISAGVSAVPAVQSAQRPAAIDEANVAGMGTFYRVRLGPFNDAAEPGKLCSALKPQGYDCMVIAQ